MAELLEGTASVTLKFVWGSEEGVGDTGAFGKGRKYKNAGQETYVRDTSRGSAPSHLCPTEFHPLRVNWEYCPVGAAEAFRRRQEEGDGRGAAAAPAQRAEDGGANDHPPHSEACVRREYVPSPWEAARMRALGSGVALTVVWVAVLPPEWL